MTLCKQNLLHCPSTSLKARSAGALVLEKRFSILFKRHTEPIALSQRKPRRNKNSSRPSQACSGFCRGPVQLHDYRGAGVHANQYRACAKLEF